MVPGSATVAGLEMSLFGYLGIDLSIETGHISHGMLRRPPTLDEEFRALADPTRRGILEQLERGPAGTSRLAANFDMALSSFLQHMAILERCGLVRSMKLGRIRIYKLAPKALQGAHAWLGRRRRAGALQRRRAAI